MVLAPHHPDSHFLSGGTTREAVPQGPGSGTAAGAKAESVQRIVSSLISSVRAVRGPVPAPGEVAVVDLADAVDPRHQPSPEGARVVADVLRCWWNAATRIGQCAGSPIEGDADFDLESAVRRLGSSGYFGGSPELPLLEARMLGRYLTDKKFRYEARDLTRSVIGPAARVVVGHGLGALAAYEALCSLGDDVSVALVTLSAPMCGSEEVFNRLDPAPRSGQGHWPAAVRRWFNIVAHSDPTAMAAPRLTERFGTGIEDEIIEIRSASAQACPYLLDRVTGRAMAAGLG
jgi:hypothetical protein